MPSCTVPPANAARHYRPPSRVALVAARALGLQPETVHQSVYGHAPVHQRLATILEAAIGLGDHGMVERLMRPIERVLSRRPVEPLSPAVICEAQAADSAEDMAEVQYLAAPSNDSLRGWLTEVRRERAELLRLESAISSALESRPWR